MALGINFSGRSNVGPVTVEIGDVTVAGEMITANGVPVCVKYLDPNGDVQFDAVLMVTTYDPADVTVQPNPVGLFEIQTGNVLVPYSLPGGITDVEWSFGDCAAFLAEYLEQISVDLSAIATAIANIEADVSAIATSTANIDALLTSILSVLNDINVSTTAIATSTANIEVSVAALTNTSTHIQHFCDQFEGGTQRFFTLYVINNDTGLIVSSSSWYNNPANNNALEPYTPVGTVGGVDCCPPDDCPPVIGTQLLCLQTVDPCDPNRWNLVVDMEEGTATVTIDPILGNNAPFTVEWISDPGITVTDPLAVTTGISFANPGTLTAIITVDNGGTPCEVVLVVEFTCDASINVTQETASLAYTRSIRWAIVAMSQPIVLISIGTYIYTAVNYTAQTGNPAPAMDDPAAMQTFLDWIVAQHPTNLNIYLQSYTPIAQNTMYVENCANENIEAFVFNGVSAVSVAPELYIGFSTTTNIVCSSVICLTATMVVPEYSIEYATGFTWVLPPGVTLVTGTLTDPTICVTGTGTVIASIQTEYCDELITPVVIDSGCNGSVIINTTPSGEVCAGIDIDTGAVVVDDVNRKLVFPFEEADTITGNGSIQQAIFVSAQPYNVLNPALHEDDPNYSANIGTINPTGTYTLAYLHVSAKNLVPIKNGGSFNSTLLQIILANPFTTIPNSPNTPIVWNSLTDPTGATFKAAVQAQLNAHGTAYNCDLRAAVYVDAFGLWLQIRMYKLTGIGIGAYTVSFNYVPVSGNPILQADFKRDAQLVGTTLVRQLNTNCGIVATTEQFGLDLAAMGYYKWYVIDPGDYIFFSVPFPNFGPWAQYPECCQTPATLTAVTSGTTATGYTWVLSGGLVLVGGSLTSQAIQVSGTGTAQVSVITPDCGTITKTVTI